LAGKTPSRAEGSGKPEQTKDEKTRAAEAKTAALGVKAVEVSRDYGGKLEVLPALPITGMQDFAYLYTPGIAQVSREIAKDPEKSFELTGRWNTIGIVTDGSRVLGLGDIGPRASMPVMEGKALLFKFLGGVNAFPLPLKINSGDEIVETVQRLEPALGGINLEDISSPKCFDVLEKLQKSLTIPVWHDDQLGTAAATVAGLLNALEITGKKFEKSNLVVLGSGAANVATVRLLKACGADMGGMKVVDSKGIMYGQREDMDAMKIKNRWKHEIAMTTNDEGRKGGMKEAMVGADAIICASTPNPDTVKPEWIKTMNKSPTVFALANPVPEIWPAVAKDAGAAIVATGRSDFPNQVNNSLVFPPVFRGVLDARAKGIPDEVVIMAAKALAKGAAIKGLTPDHILPTMDEEAAFPAIAVAVALKVEEVGLARVHRTRAEYENSAKTMLARQRKIMRLFIEQGLNTPPFAKH
jgi:malate dehydrogenase (oxaloacetate-decarboxylating)